MQCVLNWFKRWSTTPAHLGIRTDKLFVVYGDTEWVLGEEVVNIRPRSSLNGWKGTIIGFGKRYTNFTGGKGYQQVDEIIVGYEGGMTGSYLVTLVHGNLRKSKETSKMAKHIVWCPQGSNPSKIHESHKAAQTEAERLAALDPGKEFYVASLRSVSQTERVVTRKVV